jgi:hypothetical protein
MLKKLGGGKFRVVGKVGRGDVAWKFRINE